MVLLSRKKRAQGAAAAILGGGLLLLVLPRAGEADDRTRDAGAARPVGGDGGRGGGDVQPADLEDVEHMCVLLTSCERLPLPSGIVPKDFASCTRSLYAELASAAAASFSLTLRECGLRASSCFELRACALRGAKPAVCAGRGKAGPVDMCDADGRAITCTDERVTLVRDCPRGGEQCAVRDGQAVCALGPCAPGGADAGGPSCSASGTRILQCEKGKLVSVDCAAFGLKCASEASGAACAPATAACNRDSKRCEGNVAVECLHGHEVRVDCGASGLQCAGPGTPVGACVAPAPASGACDSASPSRCDGASIKYCASGRPRSYLCKSLAFTRCVVEGKGARCAN